MRSSNMVERRRAISDQRTYDNVNNMMDGLFGEAPQLYYRNEPEYREDIYSQGRGASRTSLEILRAVGATSATSVMSSVMGVISTIAMLMAKIGFIIFVLIGLVVCSFINSQSAKIQEKLRNDATFNRHATEGVNGLITIWNMSFLLLKVAVEIWNIALPFLSFLVYFFYAIIVKIISALYGKATGKSSSFQQWYQDPYVILSSGTDPGYLDALVCIMIDLSNITTGCMRFALRNAGKMLLAILDWMNGQAKSSFYRNAYCNLGDSESGDNLGPEGNCPDNSRFINSILDIAEKFSNVITDIVVQIIPIVCDILKSIFDTIMQILPELLEGLIGIIEMFTPGHPLGDAIIYVLNILIDLVGFLSRSCIVQLVMNIAMCAFNFIIALVVNEAMAIALVIRGIVCLGGLVCDVHQGVKFMRFSSCDWTLTTQCFNQNYDGQSTNRTKVSMCVPDHCTNRVIGFKHLFMHEGRHILGHQADHPKRISQYKECIKAYARNYSNNAETLESHYFCHHLSEHIHSPAPLGMDPNTKFKTFDEPHEFCEQKAKKSCYCSYDSPICESQVCCIEHYNILLGQILARFNATTCGDLRAANRKIMGIYCVTKTQTSLQMTHEHLQGTAMHCESMMKLVDASCTNKTDSTPIHRKAVVGGTCKHIDQLGFCDAKRRPVINVGRLMDPIVDLYNRQLDAMENTPSFSQNYRKKSANVDKNGKKLSYDKLHSAGRRFTYTKEGVRQERDLYPSEKFLDDVSKVKTHFHIMYEMSAKLYPVIKRLASIGTRNGLTSPKTEPHLYSTFLMPTGKMAFTRKMVNEDWKDLKASKNMYTLNIDGTHTKWDIKHASDHDWDHLFGDSAVTISKSCTEGQQKDSYPGKEGYDCMKTRSDGVSSGTASAINTVSGDGGGQQQMQTMTEQKTNPIRSTATDNQGFNPIREYSSNPDYRKNKTSIVNTTWSGANPGDNIDHNFRVPLTTNTDHSGAGPGGFNLYGSESDDDFSTSGSASSSPFNMKDEIPNKSLKECPVPVEFPWEKVFDFKKENSLTNKLMNKLRSIATEEDIKIKNERFILRRDVKIPSSVTQSVKAMYGKRGTSLGKHVGSIFDILNDMVGNISHTTHHLSEAVHHYNYGKPRNKPYDSFFDWWSSSDTPYEDAGGNYIFVGKPVGPTNGPDVCVADVKNPYNCCERDTSAYRCCFGLLLCIPDLPNAYIHKIQNFSFVANATCDGAGNIISSLTIIPRLLFSKLIWDRVILKVPPIFRGSLLKVLYPIAYDHGGAGVSNNIIGELFCMVVNFVYIFYGLAAFIGFSILDSLIITPLNATKARADTGFASVRATQALDEQS